ncbi:MAG: 4a-hydroxytetrahydrobiopterin dehydratase [Chitinivibrionales bacterium]
MDLNKKKCVARGKDDVPLDKQNEDTLLTAVDNWELVRTGIHALRKTFRFTGFSAAIGFVVEIALLAEAEGHHPNIHIYYAKVEIELSTHSIGGLSENDFILAAKIDELQKRK